MWQCVMCGATFGADPQSGDPLGDLEPGRGKGGVPEDLTCPNCGATGKENFKKVEEE
ncbi:MAG: rubredoxin [Bacillota bacterium]